MWKQKIISLVDAAELQMAHCEAVTPRSFWYHVEILNKIKKKALIVLPIAEGTGEQETVIDSMKEVITNIMKSAQKMWRDPY